MLGTSRELGAFQGRKAFDKIKKTQSKDAPEETKVKEYVPWQRYPKFCTDVHSMKWGLSRRGISGMVWLVSCILLLLGWLHNVKLHPAPWTLCNTIRHHRAQGGSFIGLGFGV